MTGPHVATFLFCLVTLSWAHSHTESPHSHSHTHEPPRSNAHHKESPIIHDTNTAERSNDEQIWFDTVGAVAGVSIAPFVLLFLVPDLNTHQNLLKVLLAFAAGGLLGDAFLHLIPHALSHESNLEVHDGPHHGHSHNLSNHDVRVSLWVIVGIFGFLCIDKFLRLLMPGGQHSHSNGAANENRAVGGTNKKQKSIKGSDAKVAAQPPVTNNCNKKSARGMSTAGYLNLAADFTHNFTDGIAIASSFLINRNVGFVTTLTVLIHELPHELGDYAILVKSGCSAYRAMLLQLLTAGGALTGACLSLVAAGVSIDTKTASFFGLKPDFVVLSPEVISTCFLPLVAGGFIYIALVSVMPDLLAENSAVAGRPPADTIFRRLGQAFAEIIALCTGVGLMAAICLFE